MLLVAPLSGIAYQFLDPKASVQWLWWKWYYSNAYYLFFTVGPHLSDLMIYTGLFLLFPADSRRAWFLVIPTGLTMSKILWLGTVTTNEQFHQIVPLFFVVVAGLIAVVWLFTFNWLMHRQFHEFDSICKRILQIVDASGVVDAKTQIEMIAPETEKLRTFHNKY